MKKIEPLHPIQLARFRVMTFQEKWAVSQSLFRMAWQARMGVTRRAQPDLNEKECRAVVAKEFLRART